MWRRGQKPRASRSPGRRGCILSPCMRPGPSAACSSRTSRGPPPSRHCRPCRQGAGDCSPSPGPPHPLCCMTCAQAHSGTGLECVSFGAWRSWLVLSVLIHLVGVVETLPNWLVRPRAEGKRPKWQVETWWAASQRTPIGTGGLPSCCTQAGRLSHLCVEGAECWCTQSSSVDATDNDASLGAN